MNREHMQEYLDEGGTDVRYLIEHIAEHTTDPYVRELIERHFQNVEDE